MGTIAVTVPGLVLYNIYVLFPEKPGEEVDPWEFLATVLHEFYHHLVYNDVPKEQHSLLLEEPLLSFLEEWAMAKANECLVILRQVGG